MLVSIEKTGWAESPAGTRSNSQLLRQARAAHSLETFAGLKHQPAVGAGADDRVLGPRQTGRGIGAADGDLIAQLPSTSAAGESRSLLRFFSIMPPGKPVTIA